MSNLVIFEKICEFVADLAQLIVPENTGDNSQPPPPNVDSEVRKALDLYRFLVIEKTTVAHKTAIEKHVQIFRDFCVQNRDAIYEKDIDKFVTPSIVKSEKAKIEVVEILKALSPVQQDPVWKYLLYISAFVDPTGKARELYQKSSSNQSSSGSNILTGLFEELRETTEGRDDLKPQDAVQAVMQSGFAAKLTTALSSGELDMGSLFSEVMNMAGEAGKNVGDDPEAQQALSMINGLMGMMGPVIEGVQGGGMPAAGISGILGNAMGGGGGEQHSLDEEITREAELSLHSDNSDNK